jgi:purine-binding chemotaxis protein CheW
MQTYLLCRIHGERFAFDVEKVDEVVRMPWVTQVTETPADVRGIINFRGGCIAVVDPAFRLCGEGSEPGIDSFLVVVRLDADQVALIVDGVESLVEASPEPAPSGAASPGFVLGHFDDGQGLTTVVDVAEMLWADVQDFIAHTRTGPVPPR